MKIEMEQSLLLDAVERYHRGEMSAEERKYFEDLRQKDPNVDQLVVEHIFFLEQLERLSDVQRLKSVMNSVEDKLELEGAIQLKESKLKAKVIHIWQRYRRTITVAAAAAVVVSILTATGVSFYSENKKTVALTPLVDHKLNQMEHKLSQMEHKLNDVAPQKAPFEANFRATGFLIDGKGFVVTNAHVVNLAKNLIVENTDGGQFTAVAVYSNPQTDLAILKITDSSFKRINNLPYSFSKDNADIAEQVFTLGFPREDIVYNEGYLSATSGYFGDTTAYQMSIAANPGNSGGPVINRNGVVIGIISSKETNADGVVFAIKSKNIYRAVRELREEKGDSIKLSNNNHLKGEGRVQQVKNLQDFVFKVKGN